VVTSTQNENPFTRPADILKKIKQRGYTVQRFCQEIPVSRSAFYYYCAGTRVAPKDVRDRVNQLLP
jgi:hypothetical protein